ncbi:hypothetical protein BTJ49_09745 [Oleiagrimonas sp. MCCC 1A03011]|nr:hypothetical protein BTJ49_09745 [Oleiagrimonas sp. MCCC 1A03011]
MSHAPRLTALALFAWLLMAAMPTLAGVRASHAAQATPVTAIMAQMHAHSDAACGMPCCGGAGHDTGCLHACGCALTCGGLAVLAQGAWPTLAVTVSPSWPAHVPDWAGPPSSPPLRPPRS